MNFNEQDLRVQLFFPNVADTFLKAVQVMEYKVDFPMRELTAERLSLCERTQRIYALVLDKAEGTFKLKRIKIDSNSKFFFGRCLYLEQLCSLTLLDPKEWGAACFHQWISGKSFIWQCEAFESLQEIVCAFAEAFKSISPMKVQKVFSNLAALESSNYSQPEQVHQEAHSTEHTISSLAVDQLFEQEEQIDLQNLDVELLQAKWKKNKRTLNQNNATYLLNLRGKTGGLVEEIQKSSKLLQEIREGLEVAFLHSKSLDKDVQYLRTNNDALAVETKNQRAIYSTLSSLLEALQIEEEYLKALKCQDLNSLSGTRAVEEAFFCLVDRLTSSIPNEMGLTELAAVKEQRKYLSQEYDAFYDRFFDFFKELVSKQALKLLHDKNRFPRKGQPLKLVSHDELCNTLTRYAQIIAKFREVSPEKHHSLLDVYCSIIYPVYQKEIVEFLDEIAKGQCILKRHSAAITFDSRLGQPIKNVTIEYNTVFSGEVKYPPHCLWEYILKVMLPILYQEKNAISQIFDLESAEETVSRLTSTIVPRMLVLLDELFKADSSFFFKMLVETENGMLFLEEYQSEVSSSSPFFALLKRLRECQSKFLQEQILVIQEQGNEIVKCKKHQNLMSLSLKFVEFVCCMASCLRGIGPNAQFPTLSMQVATDNLQILLQEIFRVWKPLEVQRDLVLINSFAVLQRLQRPQRYSNVGTLFPFVVERLREKVDSLVERSANDFLIEASPRLIKYFDQMHLLMRYYDAEEIAFHPSFSKWKTKKLLSEYSNGTQSKSEMENLNEQVTKYFSEPRLAEIVWQRIASKFESRFTQWNSLLEQVYHEDPLMKFCFDPSEIVGQIVG